MLVFGGTQLLLGIVEHLTLWCQENRMTCSFFFPLLYQLKNPISKAEPLRFTAVIEEEEEGLSCCECSFGCSSQFRTSSLLYQDLRVGALD